MIVPGPVGKRSDAKHGHRTKEELAVDKVPAGDALDWYPPDESWHPTATRWYESLQVSGQVVFYAQSDVATAYLTAEGISRLCSGSGFSGQLYASIMSGMADLCVTEGARRRAKIELQRENVDNGPSDVDDAIRELTQQHAQGSRNDA